MITDAKSAGSRSSCPMGNNTRKRIIFARWERLMTAPTVRRIYFAYVPTTMSSLTMELGGWSCLSFVRLLSIALPMNTRLTITSESGSASLAKQPCASAAGMQNVYDEFIDDADYDLNKLPGLILIARSKVSALIFRW